MRSPPSGQWQNPDPLRAAGSLTAPNWVFQVRLRRGPWARGPPRTERPFLGSPAAWSRVGLGAGVEVWGGSCSDGWCPRFLETPPSPVFRAHGPSLRACWWVQALERATGHGGLRDSHALDLEAGGHSVGSRVGPATLPSSCPPLSLMWCLEALET